MVIFMCLLCSGLLVDISCFVFVRMHIILCYPVSTVYMREFAQEMNVLFSMTLVRVMCMHVIVLIWNCVSQICDAAFINRFLNQIISRNLTPNFDLVVQNVQFRVQ